MPPPNRQPVTTMDKFLEAHGFDYQPHGSYHHCYGLGDIRVSESNFAGQQWVRMSDVLLHNETVMKLIKLLNIEVKRATT